MADTPKLPKPKPKAASTPKAPKPPEPKAGAPAQVNPAADKPMGTTKLSKEQLNQEEQGLAKQAAERQQKSKGDSKKKSSSMSDRAKKMGGNALKGLDKAGEDGGSNKDDSMAKRGAQQVGKDAAKVASGAIKGAMKGGWAGAGIGAAKAVVKSKSFWTVILVVFGGITLFQTVISSLLLFGLFGDTDSGHESASRRDAGESVAEEASSSYGGNATVERMLQNTANTAGADFYVLSSVLAEENASTDDGERPDDGWFGLTDDAVEELVVDTPGAEQEEDLEIEDEARWVADALSAQQREVTGTDVPMDLATGYTLAVTSGGRTPIEGQDELREQTFDTWIEVVETIPIVDADSKAQSIVDRARNWKVGGAESGGGPICTPGGGGGGSDSVNIPDEYLSAVEDAAAESGFSTSFIGAQIQAESGWDPNAQSPVGAMGIAQFMPGTWPSFGEGGDPWDPEDSIAAQGRYMKYLREFMEDHAEDEEHLAQLALAGYNAGQGRVQQYNFDLDEMFKHGEFRTQTKPYVEKILAASEGDYTSDCVPGGGGDVPTGSVTEASMYLAWDNIVSLPSSMAHGYGRSAAKPEFVEVSSGINSDFHTAYFTDCGVFVATVMRSSGADESFPVRGTAVQQSYLRNSDKYETFYPSSEGDLQSGDILFLNGHIFIYTGERHTGSDGRSQGASLSTRPPSGHHTYLSDGRGGYEVARLVNAE
ncbi:MAG: lytic transglycosylase domain-containing protein [Yaniella sp.]|uniref:lytic transglycosylase domain-containing protein n=1 Tax=Yaniella sp. TaxID=2773929 RepID=UPI002647CD0E|nr:lytic transglycosylase domain-containing protein [Yaniella sp.]MDN5817669.1 lytic transglycosylase domain-containing protein [Yaniella sp.]MDN5837204.1 lytic transglycosylase domain-containing protein [Yaniella sp.]MDN5889212.1 lytic transglycosylase domain-containing protein [Yaniella sp.]MDN5911478.1 lytic transglycosylase domain-containing protein [Yaniella sp.]MDN6357703.1 lytic transglycosylase domain-containing protein [Yaniella sp.]